MTPSMPLMLPGGWLNLATLLTLSAGMLPHNFYTSRAGLSADLDGDPQHAINGPGGLAQNGQMSRTPSPAHGASAAVEQRQLHTAVLCHLGQALLHQNCLIRHCPIQGRVLIS